MKLWLGENNLIVIELKDNIFWVIGTLVLIKKIQTTNGNLIVKRKKIEIIMLKNCYIEFTMDFIQIFFNGLKNLMNEK